MSRKVLGLLSTNSVFNSSANNDEHNDTSDEDPIPIRKRARRQLSVEATPQFATDIAPKRLRSPEHSAPTLQVSRKTTATTPPRPDNLLDKPSELPTLRQRWVCAGCEEANGPLYSSCGYCGLPRGTRPPNKGTNGNANLSTHKPSSTASQSLLPFSPPVRQVVGIYRRTKNMWQSTKSQAAKPRSDAQVAAQLAQDYVDLHRSQHIRCRCQLRQSSVHFVNSSNFNAARAGSGGFSSLKNVLQTSCHALMAERLVLVISAEDGLTTNMLGLQWLIERFIPDDKRALVSLVVMRNISEGYVPYEVTARDIMDGIRSLQNRQPLSQMSNIFAFLEVTTMMAIHRENIAIVYAKNRSLLNSARNHLPIDDEDISEPSRTVGRKPPRISQVIVSLREEGGFECPDVACLDAFATFKALVDHLADAARQRNKCLLCVQAHTPVPSLPKDLKDWAAHIKRHLLLPKAVNPSEDPVPTELASRLGWHDLPRDLERRSTSCAACGSLVSIGSLFTHQKTSCKSLSDAVKSAIVACPCPVCLSLLTPSAMSGHLELHERSADIKAFAKLVGVPEVLSPTVSMSSKFTYVNDDEHRELHARLSTIVSISRYSGHSEGSGKATRAAGQQRNNSMIKFYRTRVHGPTHEDAACNCRIEEHSIVLVDFASNSDLSDPHMERTAIRDLRQLLLTKAKDGLSLLTSDADGLTTNLQGLYSFLSGIALGHSTMFVWHNNCEFAEFSLEEIRSTIGKMQQGQKLETPCYKLLCIQALTGVNKHVSMVQLNALESVTLQQPERMIRCELCDKYMHFLQVPRHMRKHDEKDTIMQFAAAAGLDTDYIIYVPS